jgi:precorrin-2 dehydrogenase / sirohydrochlorin ferrochelatase
MRYYPVGLDIKDRLCLVVGGGQVGTRKVNMLLACGARVTVVSPLVSAELALLAERGRIVLERRPYRSSDLNNAFLVIGATDDMNLNRRVHADAEQARRLCNIADQPALCNFILPSVINQGDLTITISTAGRSPAFAKYMRRHLQEQFGPEYARFLQLMGAVRKRLLAAEHAPEAHKPIFERLIQSELLELIKTDNAGGIDALLAEILGPGFTYDELMAQE